MRFSQRIGKIPIRTVLQIESIDDKLKNKLWNEVLAFLNDLKGSYPWHEKSDFFRLIWVNFFGRRIDNLPTDSKESLSHWFNYSAKWYEIYDFIEFFIENTLDYSDVITDFNNVLKSEFSGYRIINNKIIQITAEEEIAEVENAFSSIKDSNPINIHLQTAIDHLANRTTPDYRNSIKEAISAVEALCRDITGDKKATLGQAIKKIKETQPLHPALEKAFSSLYGFTSDSGGIRHAILDDQISIDFEEAKFMLVTCSAFINYLRTKNTRE